MTGPFTTVALLHGSSTVTVTGRNGSIELSTNRAGSDGADHDRVCSQHIAPCTSKRPFASTGTRPDTSPKVQARRAGASRYHQRSCPRCRHPGAERHFAVGRQRADARRRARRDATIIGTVIAIKPTRELDVDK